MWVFVGAFVIVVLATCGGMLHVYRRKRVILSLSWPRASTHYGFVRLCRDYLILTGWKLEVDSHGAYDLKVTREDLPIVLICRLSGWDIGQDFVDRAINLERQARVPVTIVSEDMPTDIEFARAEIAGAKLIPYSRLSELEDIARERRRQFES